ncbi:MAG: hypothetical protein AB9891_21295 [Anaerolineaceae bacterium]
MGQEERPTRVESHKILVDDYAGVASVVDHLINLGHTRIGFIGSDPGNYYTNLSIDEQL